MDYNNADYQSVLDMLVKFFEYIKTEVFSDGFTGLLMHLYTAIPVEVRMYIVSGVCLLLFLAFLGNIRK